MRHGIFENLRQRWRIQRAIRRGDVRIYGASGQRDVELVSHVLALLIRDIRDRHPDWDVASPGEQEKILCRYVGSG